MLLYVIRHGETQWNKEMRAAGHTDVPLNENGRELARLTRDGLRDVKFDLCISSPLCRADETARIILEGRDIPFIYDERLKEIYFGNYEGKVCIHPDGMPKEELSDYMSFRNDTMNFKGMPGGGESIPDLLKRSAEFLDEIMAKAEYQDKTILISTHGCLLRGMLHRFYPEPDVFWYNGVPKNCAVSVVEVKDKEARLIQDDKIYYNPKMSHKVF